MSYDPKLVDKIIAFESGEMSHDEIISFFQQLIDTGLVWQLQGAYGRAAEQLILSGACTAKS
jgi:hypothetical protein